MTAKKLFPVFLAVLIASLLGCGDPIALEEQAIVAKESRRQAWVDQIFEGISYVKDPRTNICFATGWEGEAHGGPMLATIPCESVPKDLLRTANPSKKE